MSALWDGPRELATLVVLAPGAGADMRADFMEHFARRLSERGATVCRFNFLYSERGRKTTVMYSNSPFGMSARIE